MSSFLFFCIPLYFAVLMTFIPAAVILSTSYNVPNYVIFYRDRLRKRRKDQFLDESSMNRIYNPTNLTTSRRRSKRSNFLCYCVIYFLLNPKCSSQKFVFKTPPSSVFPSERQRGFRDRERERGRERGIDKQSQEYLELFTA